MTVMKKIITAIAVIAAGIILFPGYAKAAPQQMPDGTVFDPVYYAENNPDVEAAVGNDANALYSHYVTYGKAEGRMPAGQTAGSSTAQSTGTAAALIQSQLPKGMTLVGTYATTYDVAQARSVNMTVAAARINGMTLKPGEEFSFSTSVLPRTSANGYVVASTTNSAGKTVSGMGDGICQVATTLYQAMLISGIPATERYPHSFTVDYAPTGDAAIAAGYKDLKFVNTMDRPLLIQAACANGVAAVNLVRIDSM